METNDLFLFIGGSTLRYKSTLLVFKFKKNLRLERALFVY